MKLTFKKIDNGWFGLTDFFLMENFICDMLVHFFFIPLFRNSLSPTDTWV